MTLLKPVSVDGLASVRWDDARKAIGTDVIPLTVADMDYATPQPVVDAVVARAAAGNYCYTYLTDEYYDAVVEWMRDRHHWTITAEEIIAVGRMVESLPAILRETVGEGAQVVVPYPAYSPTPTAVRAAGCHVVPWSLKMEGDRFVYDFDSLPFLLEDADAMVITNPHNPTCRVWTENELRRIATIAEQAGVLVISDEFHMDLTTPGHDFIPYLTCVDDPRTALAISFTSPARPSTWPVWKRRTSSSQTLSCAARYAVPSTTPDATIRDSSPKSPPSPLTANAAPAGRTAGIGAQARGPAHPDGGRTARPDHGHARRYLRLGWTSGAQA